MTSGKLDEELAMSGIADAIEPGSLLLCNESFASTNEREGSEIARQVIRALVDRTIGAPCVLPSLGGRAPETWPHSLKGH